MTDGDLLVFGCAVSFITLAGVYVYLRERFRAHMQQKPSSAKAAVSKPRRAA
jgi:hypothetical protein